MYLHPAGRKPPGPPVPGWSRYPRAVGPTFMRRLPPRDTVSTSIRISISGALPGHLVPVIAPGAGEGLAGLPGDQLAGFRMADPGRWAGYCSGVQMSSSDFGPVVDDECPELQAAGQGDQLLGLPVLLALALASRACRRGCAGIGEVEPEDVNFPVIRQKLGHLIPHVLGVALCMSRPLALALRRPGSSRRGWSMSMGKSG